MGTVLSGHCRSLGLLDFEMIVWLYAVVIFSQAVYWLFLRDETDRLAQVYFDACVDPGKTKLR